MSDITDGASNTIAVVEASPSGAANWMEPRDIPLDQALVGINVPGGIQSDYPDGLPVQMIPYGEEFLPVATSPDALRAMLTLIPDGKDKAPEPVPSVP